MENPLPCFSNHSKLNLSGFLFDELDSYSSPGSISWIWIVGIYYYKHKPCRTLGTERIFFYAYIYSLFFSNGGHFSPYCESKNKRKSSQMIVGYACVNHFIILFQLALSFLSSSMILPVILFS